MFMCYIYVLSASSIKLVGDPARALKILIVQRGVSQTVMYQRGSNNNQMDDNEETEWLIDPEETIY